MTPIEAQEYLHSFINYENYLNQVDRSLFKLERVGNILNHLGSPHKKIKFIHIAGTKGKGSTCAFIAFVLREAGYKVGLYTSPHLYDYQERIRILPPCPSYPEVYDEQDGLGLGASPLRSGFDPVRPGFRDWRAREWNRRIEGLSLSKGKAEGAGASRASGLIKLEDPFPGKIGDQELVTALEDMKPIFDHAEKDDRLGRLSFFEVLTSLAIYYFQKRQVDFVVLETGLGGRWDATNVVDSCVCGLTPISLDHTQQLGSTIEEITQEKAAIIKNKDQWVVVAPQDPGAYQIIRHRCREYQVSTLWVGEDIRTNAISENFERQTFRIQSHHNGSLKLETRLLGAHQIVNAAVALGVVESLQHLGFPIDSKAIQRGIGKTLWPGRFEVISTNPFVILDGAHNPASAQALVKTIQDFLPGKKVTLIFGVSMDKDKRGIAREFHKIAQRIICTRADHPRACPLTYEESEDLFPDREIITTRNVPEALAVALERMTQEDVILISGSLFVAGEARRCLLKDQSIFVNPEVSDESGLYQ